MPKKPTNRGVAAVRVERVTKAERRLAREHRKQVAARRQPVPRCSSCHAYGVPLEAGRCARCP